VIVGISTAIIILTVVLAFSAMNHPVIVAIVRYGLGWLFVKTGLYGFWLFFSEKRNDKIRKLENEVEKMKRDVRKLQRRRVGERLERTAMAEEDPTSSDEKETASGSNANGTQGHFHGRTVGARNGSIV
jgi:hypothetical protein